MTRQVQAAANRPALRLCAVLAGLLACAPAVAADPVPVALGPVATAAAFLDTMGVSVHWEQRDGVYVRRSDAVVAAILRLGFPHVRGFDPKLSATLARHGVGAMAVVGPEAGDPAAIVGIVRRANHTGRVIDAVEGPNEADLFWKMHGYSYAGEGFPAGVLAYQQGLFNAFKNAPGLADIVIIGPSLGNTYDPGGGYPNPFPPGSMAHAVDLGNFHPYPFGGNPFSAPTPYGSIERYFQHGNFPSVNLEDFPYALSVYAPPFAPQPMASTETGYPTWRDGVPEAVQAAYLPRLLAEYFRLGIRRTYLYELVDNQPDPAGGVMDDHFGLLRNDLTPKPAFEALRSLTALLSSGAQHGAQHGVQHTVDGPAPGVALAAHMPPGYDRAAYVHSLLLRVSATHSLLLAWHEVADADTSATPPRTLTVPDGRLDVTADAPYTADAWYDYDANWALRRHAAGAGAVTVPLQDRIVVVSLRRAAKGLP